MQALTGTRIRTAKPRHDPPIAAMEAKFFPKHALSAMQIGYYRRRQAAFVVLSLDADDRISAYAIGSIAHRGGTTVLWIVSMATVRAGRRQGIGRQLLRHALGRGKSLGAVIAKLHVGVANRPAMRLYETAGFRLLRVVTDYYGRGKHAALMSRELTTSSPE